MTYIKTQMTQHLLLLHGAVGSSEQFRGLKTKLASVFVVHTLDFEGHGPRASTKEFTIALFTENVIQYIQEHGLSKVHVFGYSMGGYVALNLALKHPEYVEKICTLGTKFAWSKETAAKEIKMLNPEKIAEKVPAFAQKLATIHTNNPWEEVMNKTAKMMYGLGTGQLLATEELEAIPHKVLISVGQEDQMVSIEESQESAGLLPNGSLKIIPNFQHPIEKVNEDVLSTLITDFLNK